MIVNRFLGDGMRSCTQRWRWFWVDPANTFAFGQTAATDTGGGQGTTLIHQIPVLAEPGRMLTDDIGFFLVPGDVLLYRPSNWFGRLISIKTWSPVSHSETYLGGGVSAAARDGLGVNSYPTRLAQLHTVLRPQKPFDLVKAQRWHASVAGQGYDWLGLLSFFTAAGRPAPGTVGRMFCSEHTTRIQRAGGVEPFAIGYDADRVSPGMFLSSIAYAVIVSWTPAAVTR